MSRRPRIRRCGWWIWQKAAAFARKRGLVSIVDNTFASPALQKPIELGFDIVVHSATKYLGGHSDIIAGAAAGSSKWMDRVRSNMIYLGGSMDPGAAFLADSRDEDAGRAHGQAVRDGAWRWRNFWPGIRKSRACIIPGCLRIPDHRLAKRQMRGFGAMMAFDMKGGLKAARRFCDRVRSF